MPALATRPWLTASVALAGAGVIAVAPVTAPLPGVIAADIQLTAGAADMVLDLVRHGQSEDNVSGIIGTVPPGAPLTEVGQGQAITVGESLYNDGNNDIAGVWASEFLRTQQTAWPLVQLLAGNSDYTNIPDGPTPLLDPSQILPGLNELNAGVLEGTSQSSQATALMYLVAPIAWMFGQYWVPQLGSDIDPNGMAFQERFSDAIDTIYNSGASLDGGDFHEVAFSHAAAISTWVMMNVKNPDFGLYFEMLQQGILRNTGDVVLEGNPTDGWTLVSWDGHEVAADPGLATNLFVDFRDLITAPQTAFYEIGQAFGTGDWQTIMDALQSGFDQIGNAFLQFPVAVWDDIMAEFQTVSTTAATDLASTALAF